MSTLLPDWGVIAALVAFALCVGSFLNVVVYRLPRMMERDFRREAAAVLAAEPAPPTAPDNFNLSVPRSHCPGCGRMVRGHENIPVLSWLWLRGRCAGCGNHISARYPLIETLTAALSVIVLLNFGVTPTCAFALLFTWWIVALAVIDLDTFYLPDALTLPLLWLGLIANALTAHVPLDASVWGAVAGYGVLWSVAGLFRLITGKEGMGQGDFKLLAALGAWLGWQQLLTVIIVSSAAGAIVGLALIARDRTQRGNPIPFGPFLAGAGWLVLLWGDNIAATYSALL